MLDRQLSELIELHGRKRRASTSLHGQRRIFHFHENFLYFIRQHFILSDEMYHVFHAVKLGSELCFLARIERLNFFQLFLSERCIQI